VAALVSRADRAPPPPAPPLEVDARLLGTAKPLAFEAFESLPGDGAAMPTTIALGGAVVLSLRRELRMRCCTGPVGLWIQAAAAPALLPDEITV